MADFGAITIRMYRGILGDCFLLTHRRKDKVFRALIDCGVLQCIGAADRRPRTKVGTLRMQDVAADLMRETGGKLDLMVATHAHYDHLSGFILAFDILKPLKIKQLWLAWAENLEDPWVNALRQKGVSARKAIADLLKQAAEAEAEVRNGKRDHPMAAILKDDHLSAIQDLMQFYGEFEPVPEPAGMAAAASAFDPDKKPISCDGVMEWLKARAGRANVRFLEPGDQVAFGIDGLLKANVLGPPRDIDRLKQMDPANGAGKEVYLVRPGDALSLETVLKFQGGAREDIAVSDRPFSARHDTAPPARSKFNTYRLYMGLPPVGEKPDEQMEARLKEDADWRRIDGEWLGSAEALALKVDGDVNNTSLALAIELPEGEVLLFPADAQVGNWLSWRNQTYPHPRKAGDPAGASVDALLARTIFYKVGHHASHNATLRELGLEKMTSPHLVAMIPVVEEVAREQSSKTNPTGWAMPYGELFTRLNEKTAGRVLKGDGVRAAEEAAFAGSAFDLRYPDGPEPLWVEVQYPRDA